MTEPADEVYPDLLRTGLRRIGTQALGGEFLPILAALDYFRRDLHGQKMIDGILGATQRYLLGLDLFRVAGFSLVNPEDHGFDLADCQPGDARDEFTALLAELVRLGRFAAALQEPSLVFFETGSRGAGRRGVFHRLAVPGEVLGMFCGILRPELPPGNEIAFSLLSLLLGAAADALATMRRTSELTLRIKTLSGLVPICAWCHKIRSDRGYWEQIEDFVESQSGAGISHGICPECQARLLGGYEKS